MKKIISAVKGIYDVFKLIWDLISNLINTLGMLITYLNNALRIATSFIGTLPNWLYPFALITLSISITYMLLGRKGGSD